MAKLLVAGATGLVGGEFVRQATAAGHEVTLLCRRETEGPWRTIVADLAEPNELQDRLFKVRFDAIVYLAQASEHNAFPDNARAAVALNIASPVALCEWAVRNGCSQFIYASSGGVCGPSADATRRIHEDWPRKGADQLSFYLSTKARCEELLLSFASLLRIDLLRYFFVYGPGQRPSFLFPRLAGRVRDGLPIELPGGTGPLINPIHVSDVAALTLAAIGSRGPSITQVAGLEDTTLADIVRTMEQVIGRKALITIADVTPPVYLADTQRMRQRLGVPRIQLADGLPAALRSFRP